MNKKTEQKLRRIVQEEYKKILKEKEKTYTFGGEKVSKEMYDELMYDKEVMQNAMADTFKTPDNYELKNKVKKGDKVKTDDGDTVEVKKIDLPKKMIDVKVIYGPETVKNYKKWGIPLKNKSYNITWSLKQFDTIVG